MIFTPRRRYDIDTAFGNGQRYQFAIGNQIVLECFSDPGLKSNTQSKTNLLPTSCEVAFIPDALNAIDF